MNRQEKRKLFKEVKKATKTMNLADEDIKNFVKFKNEQTQNISLKEGEKVKLNFDSLTNEPDFKNKVDEYKQFILNNKDKVFTVKYDYKYRKNPWLVCLQEDETKPKWLFTTNDLIRCSAE